MVRKWWVVWAVLGLGGLVSGVGSVVAITWAATSEGDLSGGFMVWWLASVLVAAIGAIGLRVHDEM